MAFVRRMVGDGRPTGLNGTIKVKARLRSFNMRAVQFTHGKKTSICGVLRLSGKTSTTIVDGLCIPFQSAGGKVFIDKGNAFFYGSLEILKKNIRREMPFSNKELSGFVNRGPLLDPLAAASQSYLNLSPKLKRIHFLIPLSKLPLSPGHFELIREMMREVERDIPNWVLALKTVRMKRDPSDTRYFYMFPKKMEEAAASAKRYYALIRPDFKKSRVPKNKSRPILAKKPLEQFPDWFTRSEA